MNRERAPVHKLLPRDEHHWCALAPKHVVKIKRVSSDITPTSQNEPVIEVAFDFFRSSVSSPESPINK